MHTFTIYQAATRHTSFSWGKDLAHKELAHNTIAAEHSLIPKGDGSSAYERMSSLYRLGEF